MSWQEDRYENRERNRVRHWGPYPARCDGPTGYCGKQKVEESKFRELRSNLLALPSEQQRAALSVLGLAIGDAVGLPYELGRGTPNRVTIRSITNLANKKDHVLSSIIRRCQKHAESPFVRTYSDDTACCDLKMEAAAQAEAEIIRQKGEGRVVSPLIAQETLRQALLQQYLKWAHVAKSSRDKSGSLFQGYGGFTFDFLVPYKGNPVEKALRGRPLYEDHPFLGPWFPTQEFVAFAEQYFSGEYGFPSWGNGAVMSMAPHPILQGHWRVGRTVSAPEVSLAAPVLSRSHQEQSAELATELMFELLAEIYSGRVGSTGALRHCFQGLKHLSRLRDLRHHDCIPVDAFFEWLSGHDCEQATAEAFLERLTGESARGDRFGLSSARASPEGIFGRMLHIAADWDNDHSLGLPGFPPKLQRKGSSEPVLFSQRGINSLIIGIFCASNASDPWDFLIRVIDVGGDTDTVGAVAGQIACPLLNPESVMNTFEEYVALERIAAEVRGTPHGLAVANAAARRFFRRALLFAAGEISTLVLYPSLVDPVYAHLTNESGTRLARF